MMCVPLSFNSRAVLCDQGHVVLQTRIVGGQETGVNEFPMMAGIVDSEEGTVFCGSTIISRKYVLTAAHCLFNRDTSILGVLVGDHDVNSGKYNVPVCRVSLTNPVEAFLGRMDCSFGRFLINIGF